MLILCARCASYFQHTFRHIYDMLYLQNLRNVWKTFVFNFKQFTVYNAHLIWMSVAQSDSKLGTLISEICVPTKMIVISFFRCFMQECFYLPSKLEFVRSNQGALLFPFAFERNQPQTLAECRLPDKP